MGRASASIVVPGPASEAEALVRPAALAGLDRRLRPRRRARPRVARPGAPAVGLPPGGRGRVLERVTAYEPRGGQTLQVEDERLRGIQRVAFAPGSDAVTITLSLDFRLKQRTRWPGCPTRFRAARACRVAAPHAGRFARERRGDMEVEDVSSR